MAESGIESHKQLSAAATLRFVFDVAWPYFLAGGVAVYALGTIVAWYELGSVNVAVAILGLAVVLLVQLMVNLQNEYWDQDTDALTTRTIFSGGSGMLARTPGAANAVYSASILCGVAGVAAGVVLLLAGYLSWASVLIIGLALAGGLAYSQPPIRLVGRGFGEIDAALIVTLLVPALAYSLQAGSLSPLLVATCLPGMAMLFTMLMAIAFPDYDADLKTGKHNLVVRLGRPRAVVVHACALTSVFIISILLWAGGWLPPAPAMLPLVELPLAVVQIWLVKRVAEGDHNKAPAATFCAVSLIFFLHTLQMAGFLFLIFGV